MNKILKKILIPNRGEIAVRIIKTAARIAIETVVMLTKKEQHTLPAKLATNVFWWPDEDLSKTYLNTDKIIEVAKELMVDAIHPGYGFLSENHHLASACIDNHIVFIGPKPEHLKLMGDKLVARQTAMSAKIPVVPGWDIEASELDSISSKLPYPVLIKAAMGGGGKGMLMAHNQSEFIANARQASRESLRYFGDARIYVEKYFEKPRHIEVQLLADQHGNVIHLFERECSIQRRYQKVIEESPAPNLPVNIRKALTDDALKLAFTIGYENAGTIEFLLDEKGQHYFLEMNTRIQVEHPITEAITGIDLVEEQIKIAMGHPLKFNQSAIKINGHAIEARIYAESPENNFAPSPGVITLIELNKDCRIETHIESGNEVFPDYDPLIAKIISHQSSRDLSIRKLKQSLNQSAVIGIETNLHYLSKIIEHPLFSLGNYNTAFCKNHHDQLKFTGLVTDFIKYLAPYIALKLSLKNQTQYWRLIQKTNVLWNHAEYSISYSKTSKNIDLEVNDEKMSLTDIKITTCQIEFTNLSASYKYFYTINNQEIIINIDGINHRYKPSDWLPYLDNSKEKEVNENDTIMHAPLPGRIVQLNVKPGDLVIKGDLLIVLEAMKMENHLKAWKSGTIDQIMVKNGNHVKANEKLLTIY